ncbi:MAG: ABC transporter ATP-binding protein [Chloroflexi bacterium]|nr:ABC transporter ATP-binding protein [Chloroflexota bacterium]
MTSTEVALETVALSKVYPNGRGIRDISFSVRRGEVFGMLGPNGAGKTTTIRTVLDFIRPTGGSATLLGVDAQSTPLARARVGFLPGDLALSERATGRDWLRFQADLREGVDWTYAERLMEEIEADVDEPLRNLSSGNRQKIGIVNALMHRPELLVLDEPTSGLDPLIRRRVYELLSGVRARGGAVLLSSHVLPEVERICDRVGIIRRGELVAVETMATLKSRAVRRLEIGFRGRPPVEAIEKAQGVMSVELDNSVVRIAVTGELSELLRAIAPYEVTDITTGAQALEDQFMSYYDGHEDDDKRQGRERTRS